MRVAFDAGSHTLFVYEDPDGNGVVADIVAQATDASYSSVQQDRLHHTGADQHRSRPMFDNINTSTPTLTVSATDASAAENSRRFRHVHDHPHRQHRGGDGGELHSRRFSYQRHGLHTSIPGTVTIPAGASSANITITPISDTTVEGEENVVLARAHRRCRAYHVGTLSSADVKIADYAPDLICHRHRLLQPQPDRGRPGLLHRHGQEHRHRADAGGNGRQGELLHRRQSRHHALHRQLQRINRAPGQSVILTTNTGTNSGQWIAALGVHDITAWVDPNSTFWYPTGTIAEKSDLNNESYATINVAQRMRWIVSPPIQLGNPQPAGRHRARALR